MMRALADDVFDAVGKIGDKGENDESAGEKKDGAGRAAEVTLETPAEPDVGLCRFAAGDAEENVVDEVRQHQGGAEEEDREEPAVLEVEVEVGGHGVLLIRCQLELTWLLS